GFRARPRDAPERKGAAFRLRYQKTSERWAPRDGGGERRRSIAAGGWQPVRGWEARRWARGWPEKVRMREGGSPGQVLAEWFVRQISRPRHEYRRFVFNNEERVKSRIRPGDVVLVDGDLRVSQVIKYLTMSSWSHSALYIGSALLRDPARRAEVRRI